MAQRHNRHWIIERVERAENPPAPKQRRTPIGKLLKHYADGTLDAGVVVDRLRKGNPDMALIGAEIALEEAHADPDIFRAVEWMKYAKNAYENIVDRTTTPAAPIEYRIGAIASFQLAQLPNYMPIAATGKLPDTATQQKTYEDSLRSSDIYRGQLAHFRREQRGSKSPHSYLVGALAETAIVLLGQRYALQNHPDQSWLSIRAFSSQDHHGWRRDTSANAWDVNVLTQFGDAPIETGYKVQVKADDHVHEGKSTQYADCISVVRIDPDLRLDTDAYIIDSMIKEMSDEELGNTFATARLDERTEKLLDILG